MTRLGQRQAVGLVQSLRNATGPQSSWLLKHTNISIGLFERRRRGRTRFWCKFLKCMFLSGEKTLQILSGQDRGPNFRSGGCFSG